MFHCRRYFLSFVHFLHGAVVLDQREWFVPCACPANQIEDRKPEQNERRRKATKLRTVHDADEAERNLIVESLRYMCLSTAAYGRVTLRPFMVGTAGITESNFVELLCKHVGGSLNPAEVQGTAVLMHFVAVSTFSDE